MCASNSLSSIGEVGAITRILVCIGASPYGEALVRFTHEMASRQQIPWHAVYVETRKPRALSAQAQARVWANLRLAESLGATTSILTRPKPANAVLEYARANAITRIVVGNSHLPIWRRVLGLSVIERLLRQSDDVDIFVVGHETSLEPSTYGEQDRSPNSFWHYVTAVVLAAAATAIGLPVRGWMAPSNFITTYLLVLVVSALYLSFGAAALAAVCSVLAFDFFYLPPYYRLAFSDWYNLLPLLAFLAIGGVISQLVRRSRRQANAAQQREAHTHALYLLGRDLTASTDIDAVMDVIAEHWGRIFGGSASVVLADDLGEFSIRAQASGSRVQKAPKVLEPCEDAQVIESDTPAISETADSHQIELRSAHGVVGMLVTRDEVEQSPPPDWYRVVEAFTNQAALAIERVQFARQAQEAEVLKATEALQSALLSAVSHDLRTPLSSITGVLSTLFDEAYLLDERSQRELIRTALDEALRLNHLVGNLLDMSRIEADALYVTQDLNEVRDLIGTTLAGLEKSLVGWPIEVTIAPSLPLIPMDFVLMSRVLHNVIDNAHKYAPEGSPIEIGSHLEGPWLEISVADRGPGVPEPELTRIFESFYRSSQASCVSGTGLGLAISKGIVEAHSGRIWAENREGGGLCITLALPVPDQPPSQEKGKA